MVVQLHQLQPPLTFSVSPLLPGIIFSHLDSNSATIKRSLATYMESNPPAMSRTIQEEPHAVRTSINAAVEFFLLACRLRELQA